MNLYVDDTGKVLELEFRDYEVVNGVETDMGALDISAATEIEFLYAKPDGTTVSKTKTGGDVLFSADGLDGKAYYKTAPGFLDVAGKWQRQGKITAADGTIHYSEVVEFKVAPHL